MSKKTNAKKTAPKTASPKKGRTAIEQAKKAAAPALREIGERIRQIEAEEAAGTAVETPATETPSPGLPDQREAVAAGGGTPARKRHVGPGGKRAKAPKTPKEPKAKKVSLLDAAAKFCEMHCLADHATKDIVAAAPSLGWTPGAGKTPEASLYAAIIREIASKGTESRFRKTARGRFCAYNAEIPSMRP